MTVRNGTYEWKGLSLTLVNPISTTHRPYLFGCKILPSMLKQYNVLAISYIRKTVHNSHVRCSLSCSWSPRELWAVVCKDISKGVSNDFCYRWGFLIYKSPFAADAEKTCWARVDGLHRWLSVLLLLLWIVKVNVLILFHCVNLFVNG